MASGLLIVLAVATAFLLAPAGTDGRRLQQTARTVQWQVPDNGAYEAISVAVGSTVTFTWSIMHDLWRIPSGGCPASFTPSNTVVQEAPQGRNGRKAITFDMPGTYYFACSVSTHCSEGQLIQITVTGSASASAPRRGPAPAPAPVPALAPGRSRNAPSAQPAASTMSTGVSQPTEPAEVSVESVDAGVEEDVGDEDYYEDSGYGGEGYEHNYRKR